VSPPFRTAQRSTSLALLLAARTRPGDALVPRLAVGLLGLRRDGHWGSTHDDAVALLALTEYRKLVERPVGKVAAVVRVPGAGAPLVDLQGPAGSLIVRRARLALPLPGTTDPATPLRIEQNGAGLAYYTAILRWEENGLQQPLLEAGYTIERRVDPFAAPAETPRGGRQARAAPGVRLGDLVVVTLQIVVPRESYYLAIVDPLPGALEAVQTHFLVESQQAVGSLERWRNVYEPLPLSHSERRDREVRLFADWVPPGVYEHRYIARVRAAGAFGHLPARVEAMYTPELHGATPASRWRATTLVAQRSRR
jgi:hypothetical protein